MSLSIPSRSAFTLTAVTVVTGLVAYAVYFDYKRRNDAAFRRRLRKEKKRIERSKPVESGSAGSSRSIEEIKEALQMIRGEQVPATPAEKEQYFMDNVQMGEQLCTQGPMFEIPAALAFYRALRVYPSPVELIVIYQKTVPEPIFKIVMEMTSLDVKQRAEGYFESFPATTFNVSVKALPRKDGPLNQEVVKKNVLVAHKDFKAGDLIYKESPVVASLDWDLEGQGKYCSRCFRQLSEDTIVRSESDPLQSAYCSPECQTQAGMSYDTLLFGTGSAGIVQDSTEAPPTATQAAARKVAQDKFIELFKSTGSNGVMLVARFISRMVADETRKLQAAATGVAEAQGDVYTLFDHIERLRYLEFSEIQYEPQKEALRNVLKHAAEGLEEFLKEDRYGVLLGKMAYNAVGVTPAGDRSERPSPEATPTIEERTRTSRGTQHQIGCGLYFVSSYMAHSCAPNTRALFETTNELELYATKDIKAGDELTFAYVNTTKPEDEEVLIARRTRRQELAKGWRFACACERCEKEAPDLSTPALVKADDVEVEGPAAQLEKAVDQFESGTGGAEARSTLADDVE